TATRPSEDQAGDCDALREIVEDRKSDRASDDRSVPDISCGMNGNRRRTGRGGGRGLTKNWPRLQGDGGRLGLYKFSELAAQCARRICARAQVDIEPGRIRENSLQKRRVRDLRAEINHPFALERRTAFICVNNHGTVGGHISLAERIPRDSNIAWKFK